ncbi:MAG: glycosyltransferase, partial [bacterium]
LNYGIFLGRFDRIKNVDRFIKKYISKEVNKHIPLVIAGKIMDYDEEYYRKIEKIVHNQKNIFILNIEELKERYLRDFINFFRKEFSFGKRKYLLERKMVLELTKVSSFLVMPSWVESFGFTVLEALYLNKPVIVTKNSPYQEILPEFIGKNIKIIDPLIMGLDADLFVFEDFENSSNLIKERFAIEKIALRYMEVWEKHG